MININYLEPKKNKLYDYFIRINRFNFGYFIQAFYYWMSGRLKNKVQYNCENFRMNLGIINSNV
jgi:hypothetical protein